MDSAKLLAIAGEHEQYAHSVEHLDAAEADENRIIAAALREKAARDAAPEVCPECKCRRDADTHAPGYSCDYYTRQAAPADLRALQPGDQCRVDAEFICDNPESGGVEVRIGGDPWRVDRDSVHPFPAVPPADHADAVRYALATFPHICVYGLDDVRRLQEVARRLNATLSPDDPARWHDPAVPPAQPASQVTLNCARCVQNGETAANVAGATCGRCGNATPATSPPTPAASSGLAAEFSDLLRRYQQEHDAGQYDKLALTRMSLCAFVYAHSERILPALSEGQQR